VIEPFEGILAYQKAKKSDENWRRNPAWMVIPGFIKNLRNPRIAIVDHRTTDEWIALFNRPTFEDSNE
jgi:hypothetical protein